MNRIDGTMAEGGFQGFRRRKGRAGVRNDVLILHTDGLTARAASRAQAMLTGTKCLGSPYGRGQVGPDAELHDRMLKGFVRNPNVAAVVVVAADNDLAGRYVAVAQEEGKPCHAFSLVDVHEDSIELTARVARAAAHLVREASRQSRASVRLAELAVAVECGHSDFTSGLIANPVVGAAVSRLIDHGGRAILSETLEWTGAEHILAARAASPEIGARIRSAVLRRERYASSVGANVRDKNPGEQNIRGGLSTIEEKSLGAISKAGSHRISGFLETAAPMTEPGLHIMDTPYFSPESISAMVASGCQIVLFTTGPGNSYCSALAPTIKVSANQETLARLGEQIDFGIAHERRGDANAAGRQLFDYVLDVASGTLTFGEILGEGAETVSRIGPSL